MKKLSLLFVFTLLLSGCTSAPKFEGNGVIPGCDEIRVGVASDKKLELPCLDGSTSIDFHQIRGPIVINIWGSWCEGCRQEMPYFIDLYATQSFKSGQIQLLGIDVEENSPTSGPDYIKQSGMSWPHLNDVNDQTKAIFGPGVPVTWFIDSQGVVVEKHIGAYQNKKQLFDQVEKAFGITL
jgi:thiol-disulfide isomerase/thioredoxin